MLCPVCKSKLKSETIWLNTCSGGCLYTESSEKYKEVSGEKIQELSIIVNKSLQYDIFVVYMKKNKYKTIICIHDKKASKANQFEIENKKIDFTASLDKIIDKINTYAVLK